MFKKILEYFCCFCIKKERLNESIDEPVPIQQLESFGSFKSIDLEE